MSQSPVNFMMYGHTATYLESQVLKNKLLKEKLADLVRQLTNRKEENIRCLNEMNNQEEIIVTLKGEIEILEMRKLSQTLNSLNISKELNQNSRCSSSLNLDLKYRVPSKSTELPHKRVYLDINNKSIESSFQGQMLDKKLKLQQKNVKRITSYGNLYNKKSFSLNKPGFK